MIAASDADYLQDDGACFHHEDAAHDGQKQLLFGTDGDHPEHSTNGEGTRVAHEDLGRVAVEPEKPETGAEESGAENSHLTDEWVEGEIEIV